MYGIMWAALRSRSLPLLTSSSKDSYSLICRSWKLGFPGLNHNFTSSTVGNVSNTGFLDLQEVERVLTDVKADNVQVIPANKGCDWADFMVIATGRSAWHVKNIAQALIYKAKQKQKGAGRAVLPSVEGQEGGKWIVVDSGKVIVHALDEKARAYYNLESLWNTEASPKDSVQDLEKAFVKIRPKNNSKKRVQRSA